MPTPSTRTPVRIARGSYSNLNGSVSDLQDGEISYAEDQDKLYIKEGGSLVALTYTPASPAFTGTITGVNLTLSGDLTVNGTTTTINTQTLDVEDKNVVIGKVSSPSDTTADGGGWTLKGATDKTFNWVNATDAWTSSEHIHLGDNKELIVGTGSDLKISHNGTDSMIHNTTGNLTLRGDYIQLNNAANSEGMLTAAANGAVSLRFDNVIKLATSANGITVTGTVSDSLGNVRKLTNSTQTSAYTLVAADSGKYVIMQGSGGNITVPNSVFSAGDMVTLINHNTSPITIIKGTNMFYTADGSNANRTLAGKGMATLLFTDSATCYISGGGLS